MLARLSRLTRIDNLRLEQMIYKTSDSTSQPANTQPGTKKLSHTKLAIALLLQEPGLIEQLKETLPDFIKGRAVELLRALISQIRMNPGHTTAMLIEHWRDQQAAFQFLQQLASWHHTIPKEGVAAEFVGAIRQIHRQAYKQHIDRLLNKAANTGLSTEERQSLQQLIGKVKQTS